MKWFDEVNFNQNCIASRYDFLQKSIRSDEMFYKCAIGKLIKKSKLFYCYSKGIS